MAHPDVRCPGSDESVWVHRAAIISADRVRARCPSCRRRFVVNAARDRLRVVIPGHTHSQNGARTP